MPDISPKTDLRVVELFKASSHCTLRNQIEEDRTDNPNDCVCLGHFDRLYIRSIPYEIDLLSDIDRDIKNQESKSNYFYPFYIFHYSENEEKQDKLDAFWNAKLCCMVVSRVHFTPLIVNKEPPDSKLSNIDSLLASLQTLSDDTLYPTDDKCIGDKTVAIAGEWVHCVFYHTLELGDLVVVLKSNSIESCLRVQQRLAETAAVGDIYSYCGIHSSFFQTEHSIDEIAKQWDASGCTYSLRSAEESIQLKLNHISIRYSIRSVRCAKQFWDDLKEFPIAFVTGTADVLTDLSGKKLFDLIHIARVLMEGNYYRGDNPEDGTFNMYDAFDDIITRIGIQYGEVSSLGRDPKDKSYLERVGNLRDRLNDSIRSLRQDKARWIDPLVSQINILLTMIDDCVLDDLSILIWPSVEALADRLNYLYTQGKKIRLDQESQIENFLNCWDILANDITHLERQLTQNPELQSSRYYIPATLMIFYMALLDKYTDLLLKVNGEKDQKRYIPFITYSLEPRASTVCILDPCLDDDGGSNAYQGNVPLLVSLPTTMMYKPYQVSGILCHELAHYIGDTSRLRKERLSYILTSAAGMIAYAWELDGSAYSLRPDSSNTIVAEINKELSKRYQEIFGIESGFYIYQIQHALPLVFKAVYFSRELQTSLLSRYLDRRAMYTEFIEYSKSFTPSRLNQDVHIMEERLANLLRLYRECYADLAAVLCLGLTKEQYFLFMFRVEDQYLSDRSSDEKQIWELYYQAAMVIFALESVQYVPYSDWPEPSEEEINWITEWGAHVDSFKESIKKGEDIWTDEEEPTHLVLQAECVPLSEYLQKCAEEMSKPLAEETGKLLRDNVQKMLMTVSGEPNFPELQQIIAQYRENLFRAR